MEQISLFDLMRQQSDFPCDDCVFNRHGCCQHNLFRIGLWFRMNFRRRAT